MARVKTGLSARDATVSSISYSALVEDLTDKSHRDPKTTDELPADSPANGIVPRARTARSVVRRRLVDIRDSSGTTRSVAVGDQDHRARRDLLRERAIRRPVGAGTSGPAAGSACALRWR
jgi:hypothetical protein